MIQANAEKVTKAKGKVYGSYGHEGEANWIIPLGFEYTKNIEEADVVMFGGGKDVDPGFYGEPVGKRTCDPSERDRQERKDFELIQQMRSDGREIFTVGVCRG